MALSPREWLGAGEAGFGGEEALADAGPRCGRVADVERRRDMQGRPVSSRQQWEEIEGMAAASSRQRGVFVTRRVSSGDEKKNELVRWHFGCNMRFGGG